MRMVFLPEPKRVRYIPGHFVLLRQGTIAIGHPDLRAAVDLLNRRLPSYALTTPCKGVPDFISFVLKAGMRAESYRLKIMPQGIGIEVGDVAGARHAVRTLSQIMEQGADGRLPCLAIDDAPDFKVRGVYYDVCRGRVPTLAQLVAQVDRLADAKINQLQYYIEHTFRFRGHPLIGLHADPLTAADIMKLDTHCLARGIELVPSLASFGHMSNILTLPLYRKLAEDEGVGKFVTTDGLASSFHSLRGWTLSPANPEIYDFLDSLFAEFLPCFSSDQFNVCCDETFDLGFGQSHDLCVREGKGRVYLNHLLRLNELCRKYGKRMMFWGDIVRHHPEFIKELPKDVTVLDWGYAYNHNFETIRDFTSTGLVTYACPGTVSWGTLFPYLAWSECNIAGFAAAGKKHGATGLLNTDWGDGGHHNFMEYSWPGYWFGAEQAWNTGADRKSFLARFCRLFLKSNDRTLPSALRELGDISGMGFWLALYYAVPGDDLFRGVKYPVLVRRKGGIIDGEVRLDAAFAETIRRRLQKVRTVFVVNMKTKGVDPEGVLPYWIFAIDTILHAAHKLTVLGKGAVVTTTSRNRVIAAMKVLQRRFEALWMARNRRSEIQITLNRYKATISGLRKPPVVDRSFVTTLRVSQVMPAVENIDILSAPGAGKRLRWKKYEFVRFCDMHREIVKHGNVDHTIYYMCRFRCAEAMPLKVLLGYDGPVKMWIDGQELYCDPNGTNPAEPGKGQVSIVSAGGDHEVIVALGTNQGKAWGIFLQIERSGNTGEPKPVMLL